MHPLRLLARRTAVTRWRSAAGLGSVAIAALVLVGWFLDVGFLRSVIPSWPAIRPNTAIAFAALGGALFLTDRRRATVPRGILIVSVLVVAFLTLLEYASHVNLHIDELVHGDNSHAIAGGAPGRMAVATAIALLFLGASLQLATSRFRRLAAASQLLAIACLALSILSLAGYLYGVPQLYSVGLGVVGMSVPTCLLIGVLSLGSLSVRPTAGLMATVTADDAGGQLARRLLPAAVLVPFAITWLRWQGERAGLYGTQVGIAIFAVTNVIVFATLVLLATRAVSVNDRARRSANAGVLAARDRELVGAATLAAIVESSADAIIGKTLDGVITSWNRGATAMYGYSADEMIGQPVSILIPADRAGELAAILGRIAVGSGVEQFETRRIGKDGSVLDVSITVSPIRDPGGEIIGASAVVRDMSERLHAEADRQELEARLRQSERLESLGQLAGGIAHDFNNLLGVIMNYATFLIDETDDSEAVAKDALQIQLAAERAARLTRQLLIFARRETMERESLDVNAVVADLHDLLERSIGADIDLVTRTAADLPEIFADRGQIEQVLMNLVVNARDAMPAGGTLTIETRTIDLDAEYVRSHPNVEPGRYVELDVSDTGTGMSAEICSHIFEPFFTTKPKDQGTGLGLATLHGIVKDAGGDVVVYSELGIGTTFRVHLRASEAIGAAARNSAPEPVRRGDGETILVVEDQLALLEITTRLLRRNGYLVLPASDCEQAMAIADQETFELLLTDVVMPKVSGPELAARILARNPTRAVLYMSGYSDGVLGPRGVLGTDVALVQKPFTEQRLLQEVHLALARNREPTGHSA